MNSHATLINAMQHHALWYPRMSCLGPVFSPGPRKPPNAMPVGHAACHAWRLAAWGMHLGLHVDEDSPCNIRLPVAARLVGSLQGAEILFDRLSAVVTSPARVWKKLKPRCGAEQSPWVGDR